jgi:hypothetical protein
VGREIIENRESGQGTVGREKEGRETHKLSSGGDSTCSESDATDCFWQGTRIGKVGRETIEIGKMYRRRWAGRSGKGNTSISQCGGVS